MKRNSAATSISTTSMAFCPACGCSYRVTVSRTARVDDALLAALPRCLALATESGAEATTSQSARQAHYAEARSLPRPASGLPLTSAAGARPELRPTAARPADDRG